jgi:hypothetical protein
VPVMCAGTTRQAIEGDDVSTCIREGLNMSMSSFVVWAPQNCRSVLEDAAIGYRVGSGTVCVPIQVEEYLNQDHGIL